MGLYQVKGARKLLRPSGVNVKDVEVMEQRLSGPDASLNATIASEGENEAQDFLADTRPSPEQVVIDFHDEAVLSKWLNQAMGELSAREQMIICQTPLNRRGCDLGRIGSRALGIQKNRCASLNIAL